MTQEPVSHYCCVCGFKLPKMTAYELKCKGLAEDYGEGQLVFHCYGKHTQEQIAAAAANPPGFHRASEERR